MTILIFIESFLVLLFFKISGSKIYSFVANYVPTDHSLRHSLTVRHYSFADATGKPKTEQSKQNEN